MSISNKKSVYTVIVILLILVIIYLLKQNNLTSTTYNIIKENFDSFVKTIFLDDKGEVVKGVEFNDKLTYSSYIKDYCSTKKQSEEKNRINNIEKEPEPDNKIKNFEGCFKNLVDDLDLEPNNLNNNNNENKKIKEEIQTMFNSLSEKIKKYESDKSSEIIEEESDSLNTNTNSLTNININDINNMSNDELINLYINLRKLKKLDAVY